MTRNKHSQPTPRRKLTTTQVLEVRHRYAMTDPKPTIERLAQLYNVSYTTMWRTLRTVGI